MRIADGLLNLPRSYRFNLPNNLHMGASALKWGDSASFGGICSPRCSPDLPNHVETNGPRFSNRFAGEVASFATKGFGLLNMTWFFSL